MSNAKQSTAREHTQKSGKTRLESKSGAEPPSGDILHEMIAEAAYFLAQRRAFAGNHAMEDWLEAQDQVNSMLAAMNTQP